MTDIGNLSAEDYFSYFDAVNDLMLTSKAGFYSVQVSHRGHLYQHVDSSRPVLFHLFVEALACIWDQERLDCNRRSTDKKFYTIVRQVHTINQLHKKMRRFFKRGLQGIDEKEAESNHDYMLRAIRLYTSYVDFFMKWNEKIEAYVESQRSFELQTQVKLMQASGLFPTVPEEGLLDALLVDGVGFRKVHEKIALPILHKPLCEMFAAMCKRLRESKHGVIKNVISQHPLSCLKILGGIFPNEAAAKYASSKIGIADLNIFDLIKNNALMAYYNPYLDRSSIEDYLETLRILIGDVRHGPPMVEGRLVDFNGDIAPTLDMIQKTSLSMNDVFEVIAAIRHHIKYFEQELCEWIMQNLVAAIESYVDRHPHESLYIVLIWLKQGLDLLSGYSDLQEIFKGHVLLFLHKLALANFGLVTACRTFADEFLIGSFTPPEVIEEFIAVAPHSGLAEPLQRLHLREGQRACSA